MKNKTLEIIMAINEKFIMPTRVTIASIKANKKDEHVNIYILHFNISKEGVRLLESGSTNDVSIKCIKIDEREIPDVKIYFEFSKEIMIKLFAHRYLPKDVHKVIWLDGDIAVIDSLVEFYDIDISNHIFVNYEDQKVKKSEHDRLGLPDDYKYICVGVMLMNVDLMRKPQYEKDVLKFFETCKLDLTYPEQDMVNLLYGVNNQVIILGYPYRFNRFVETVHANELKSENIGVIHYDGFHQKPWKGCACRHYMLWWKYARTIKEYRPLFWKIMPTYVKNYVKKIFVKIGLILGIKKKKNK